MSELVKYYEFFLTGEIERDAANNPIKDEAGKIKVKYTRKSVPSKALMDEGLTANKFFQCEAVEVNVEKDSITSASGKKWDIGPMVDKGMTVNIFENKQKEVFKAITERFLANKYTVVIPPEAGDPVIHLSNWALPGEIVEYETGFEYFVHTRDKATKAMKKLESTTYDKSGKIIKTPVVKTTGKLFLFANEVPAKAAHIKDAIAALVEYKVPAIASDIRKEEILAQGTAAPVVEKSATADI